MNSCEHTFEENLLLALKSENKMETESLALNDFSKIAICPKASELLVDQVPFLRKNRVLGKYDDIQHYLDVQFRLLREDFVRPLRENIIEYTRSKDEANAVTRAKNDKKLNVHRNVRILQLKVCRNNQTYTCEFDFVRSKEIDYEVRIIDTIAVLT